MELRQGKGMDYLRPTLLPIYFSKNCNVTYLIMLGFYTTLDAYYIVISQQISVSLDILIVDR